MSLGCVVPAACLAVRGAGTTIHIDILQNYTGITFPGTYLTRCSYLCMLRGFGGSLSLSATFVRTRYYIFLIVPTASTHMKTCDHILSCADREEGRVFSFEKVSIFESASAMWDVSNNIVGGVIYSLTSEPCTPYIHRIQWRSL